MLLVLLAYLGGVLTIVSPCILPVLPFVFARADRPFLQNGLPMLIGMAATFTLIASLAAVAGGWAVAANEYGRMAAIILLAIFGVTLLFPELSDRMTRPLVALGDRLSRHADAKSNMQGFVSSLLLGVATGLLWSPCAGPILGLILTGAALHGANLETSFLLLAYAAGAATSLALALLLGGRVFTAMKGALGAGQWIRRGLGALVLAAVVAIALGLDTGFLTQVSTASTGFLEQSLLDRFHPATGKMAAATGGNNAADGGSMMMAGSNTAAAGGGADKALPVEGDFPSLDGATQWLNSSPLSPEALKGKVVLIDFWTYSCINCLRAIPYVRAWSEKYKDKGLVVIGVHTPEFAFEQNVDNVRKAAAQLKIDYPIAIDNEYHIWQAFDNEYWPAHYFIDAQGHIRHTHFGEGNYDESERVIQQLLAEAGEKDLPSEIVQVNAAGAEAAADVNDVKSQETYIGYNRSDDSFTGQSDLAADKPHDYASGDLKLNNWSLSGNWTVGMEHADLNDGNGSIEYRFHARDLHLVMGPASDGHPIRFTVSIDGGPPGDNHGADANAEGNGVVTQQRLYQLIRQQGAITDHTFEIKFEDPGVQAFAFTFG